MNIKYLVKYSPGLAIPYAIHHVPTNEITYETAAGKKIAALRRVYRTAMRQAIKQPHSWTQMRRDRPKSRP